MPLNSESGVPHYGHVTPNGHDSETFCEKSEKRPSCDSGYKNGTPPSMEPLLIKPKNEEPSFAQPPALGYEDCLLLPPDSYSGDKLSSESSDMTSPSSTEESTEGTPLVSDESPRGSIGESHEEFPRKLLGDFPNPVNKFGFPKEILKDDKAPTVKLPNDVKVPTVALPNNIPRSKSQHSVSGASDSSSSESFKIPTVHKPVYIHDNSIARTDYGDSEGSLASSSDCETVVPSVTIPNGYNVNLVR